MTPSEPSFKRKRTALPALPTDRVSRSVAAATTSTTTQPAAHAAVAAEDDEEEHHLAEALPPTSTKPSGAIKALSQMPAARHADACTTKTLDLQRSSN
jgi:hypothetical protein